VYGRLSVLKRALYTFLIAACGGAKQEPPQPVALPSSSATASTTPSASTTSASFDAGEKVEASASVSHGPEAVIARMRVDLRRCFTRALKNDPNLRAAIRLTIDVAPDGSVSKVTPRSTPPVPGDLEQCFVAAASKVAFDPPGGTGATYELPINLVPATP
jgi:hypothetical protein